MNITNPSPLAKKHMCQGLNSHYLPYNRGWSSSTPIVGVYIPNYKDIPDIPIKGGMTYPQIKELIDPGAQKRSRSHQVFCFSGHKSLFCKKPITTTPQKTNMAPENRPLEKEISIGNHCF